MWNDWQTIFTLWMFLPCEVAACFLPQSWCIRLLGWTSICMFWKRFWLAPKSDHVPSDQLKKCQVGAGGLAASTSGCCWMLGSGASCSTLTCSWWLLSATWAIFGVQDLTWWCLQCQNKLKFNIYQHLQLFQLNFNILHSHTCSQFECSVSNGVAYLNLHITGCKFLSLALECGWVASGYLLKCFMSSSASVPAIEIWKLLSLSLVLLCLCRWWWSPIGWRSSHLSSLDSRSQISSNPSCNKWTSEDI